jgi:hypothetical protein
MIGAKRLLASIIAAPLFAVSTPVPMRVVRGDDAALHEVQGITTWRNVALSGVTVVRDGDGTVVTVRMVDGRRDGYSEARYANGQVAYRRLYHAGREIGTHEGWWPDGSARFRYQYRNGLAEGTAEEWLASGQRARIAHYRAGQEEGTQRSWFADGTLRANYVVLNGRRYGLPGTKGCFGHDSAGVGA